MFALMITAAAASMTPSVDVTARKLDRDGVRAIYTRTVDADGTVHLRGKYDNAGGAPFHYRIKGSKVKGTIDGVAYVFPRPRTR